SPTAALSEVDGHYHIALGIPRGDTGATPQISVQVQTGEAGSEAQVGVTGTAENPIIHLTIPRGDVGDIGTLTINGKAPDSSGAVTLTMSDIDGLSDAIANAGGVKTVAGVSPDSAGNVALTAADVGALAAGGTAVDSAKLGGAAASEYLLHSDALSLDEIADAEDLDGKVATAEAVKKVKSDVDAVKSGYAMIFETMNTNVSKIALTVPSSLDSKYYSYSHLFAVLITASGSGNSSGAIGTCSFRKGTSTGTTGTCMILSDPDSIISSVSTDYDTMTITAVLKSSKSYVRLMIIS
ncbi:MAG: hypothetical protein PUH70_06510, partial [Clostridiales bacterium]|nr:hypothetical protein [Clostridiales bacterium]MDY5513446.1 hypothetical protein [Candidatus Ventricola sp.]